MSDDADTRVMWPFAPNWRTDYTVAYEFWTSIFTSDAGLEQRRGWRSTPRKSLQFSTVAHLDNLPRFNRIMDTAQNLAIVMPEVTRVARTTAPIGPDSLSVSIVDPPSWIAAGREVVLSDSFNGYTLARIDTVVGSIVTFVDPPGAREAGLRVHPALTGMINDKISTKRATSRTAEATIAFDADPCMEPMDFGEAENTFLGAEWLQFDHNWAAGLPVDHVWPRGTVDMRRGRISHYRPQDFGGAARTIDLTVRSAESIVGSFCRMRGQRGHFLCSTMEEDMHVVGSPSGSTLTVAGSDVFYGYADDPVKAMIEIRVLGWPPIARQIAAMSLVGGNTAMLLTEALPFIPANQIMRVSWLTYARFATDTLEVVYRTTEAAKIRLNIKTLPLADASTDAVLRATVDSDIRVTPSGDEREVIYL